MWHKNDTKLPQVVFADERTKPYGTEKCKTARARAQSPADAYQACLRVVDHYQVKRPSVKGGNIEPALNRMRCSRWWNRRILAWFTETGQSS